MNLKNQESLFNKSVFRWDFRTEGHDIRFGITCRDADGNTNPVVRHRRIATHQMDESGAVACQAPATCRLFHIDRRNTAVFHYFF